jgi:hypothetical protein
LKNPGTICDTLIYVLFQNTTFLHNMLQNMHTKRK